MYRNGERTTQDMVKENEESGIEEKEIRNEAFSQKVRTREVITSKNYQRSKVLGSPIPEEENERPPSKRPINSRRKVRRRVERKRDDQVPSEERSQDPELESRRKQDAIEQAFEEESNPPIANVSPPATPKERYMNSLHLM